MKFPWNWPESWTIALAFMAVCGIVYLISRLAHTAAGLEQATVKLIRCREEMDKIWWRLNAAEFAIRAIKHDRGQQVGTNDLKLDQRILDLRADVAVASGVASNESKALRNDVAEIRQLVEALTKNVGAE